MPIVELEFLAVIRARRVSERGPNPAVLLGEYLLGRLWFVDPPFAPRHLMQVGRERLGQPIGERFHQDGAVIVVLPLEAARQFAGADAGRHRKRAEEVRRRGFAAASR